MHRSIHITRIASRSSRSLRATPTLPATLRRHASSPPTPLSPLNPTTTTSLSALERGNHLLEQGDVLAARKEYRKSLEVERNAGAAFNLGVTEYQLKNTQAAISAWKLALEMHPSADAHTNIASAYILSNPPQAALAIRHLKSALELEPNDPEIAFNLAAVLESTGNLPQSLKLYQKAVSLGIKRAEQNVLNVSAKLAALKKGGDEDEGGKA